MSSPSDQPMLKLYLKMLSTGVLWGGRYAHAYLAGHEDGRPGMPRCV